MKRISVLILSLAVLLALVGCSLQNAKAESPVFETQDIIRVTFYAAAPNSWEAQVPDSYLDEIVNWLGTFTVGKQLGDVLPPGADSIFVRIEYADGRMIENSTSTILIDGTAYLINYEPEPECYFEICGRA